MRLLDGISGLARQPLGATLKICYVSQHKRPIWPKLVDNFIEFHEAFDVLDYTLALRRIIIQAAISLQSYYFAFFLNDLSMCLVEFIEQFTRTRLCR